MDGLRFREAIYVPNSYTKALNKNTTQLEALLKVIVTPAVCLPNCSKSRLLLICW